MAVWQAEHVKQLLESQQAELACELVPMTTTGDIAQNQPIRDQGGKGVFLKELEAALVEGQADIAVHSMKDVPIHLGREFAVQSIGTRGSVEDALVCAHSLHDMPNEAKFGTSSTRRAALFRHLFNRSHTVAVRGNVQTRLRKLDDGTVDGLILAAAGLERLELASRIQMRLPRDLFIPAVGQGVLAVEFMRERDPIVELLVGQQVEWVERAVEAERLVAARIGADCAAAFGAHCEYLNGAFVLNAIVLTASGEHAIAARTEGKDALEAAETIAARLLRLGAKDLLGQA